MGGKKKKTKKQLQEELERQQEELRIQEELERKRKEEEEARRIEEEKRRKELEAKLKAEEEARLAEEIVDFAPWQVKYAEKLEKDQKKQEEAEKWERFVECSTLPHPRQEKEITSYITMLSGQEFENFEKTLDKCQEIEQIIHQMHYVYGDSLERRDDDKQLWCLNYIYTMRSLAKRKIDEITARSMQNCEEHLIKMPEVNHATTKGARAATQEPVPQKEAYINGSRQDCRVGLWINHTNTGYKTAPIEFGDMKMNADWPKQYQEDSVVMRAVWTTYDAISVGHLTPEITLGGVYEVNMYVFPEVPKKMRKWIIRPLMAVEEMLTLMHYPPQDAISTASNVQACRMQYQLPSYVYISSLDTVSIGWWDAENGSWTDKDVSEQNIDSVTKVVNFKIKRFAPVAVLLPRITDFPYTSWFLRCTEDNKAILEVVGKRMEFRFVLTGSQMEFVDSMNIPELEHLRGLKSTPGYIVLELKKSGILLLPEDRDAETCGVTPKTAEAEEMAIFNMSLAARTLAFCNTKWNNALGQDIVGVRWRENLEYDETFAENDEADWNSVGFWSNKCALMNIKESDEEVNKEIPEEHVTHLSFELALLDNCTPAAQERVAEVKSVKLQENLRRTFRLLRLLSFS